MNARVFVDSNVLIYAHDIDAGEKRERASGVLETLWESRMGVLSTQVLQEFYVNVTRKIPTPLERTTAREILRHYRSWQTERIDPADVLRASEIEEAHGLNFWDALIVVAAAKGGAERLLSEDLNPGQVIEGVAIENPFSRASG